MNGSKNAQPMAASGSPQHFASLSEVCEFAARSSQISADILTTSLGIEKKLIGGELDIERVIKLDGHENQGSIGFLFDRLVEINHNLEQAAYSANRVLQRQ